MENTLLNLIPAAYLPEIHLSQYDVGRTITFTLKDGASDYSVPSGASVKVKATKPSGFGFEVACTFNGGTVTLVTTDTMTPENGRFPAELSIVSGNTTIGTSNFIFNIERSPHPEGTIDGDAESLLPELTLLVERIEAAADSVDEDTQTVTEAKAEVLQAKADTLQAKADTLSARDESVSAKDLAVSSAETSVEASQRAEQLVGSVSTKADAIVKTTSGEIASFTDGGDDLPMKSVKVNIVPKQSGSGDPSPSNVRPISGYDTVNIHVSPTTTAGDGNTYPISLGQTVYGGTLEVMSGKLTITKGYKNLGSLSWDMYTNSVKTYFRTSQPIADAKPSTATTLTQGLMCSNYPEQTWARTVDTAGYDKTFCIGWRGTTYITIVDSSYSNVADFKTAMNGVQLVYELATPTEIQLTPTQVKTLLGNNNIFADSGSVEVEYRADTTLAYNELLSLIASL